MNEDLGQFRPRPNVVAGGNLSLIKRHEAVSYWVVLGIVLMLIIWFLASSASSRGDAQDIEATVITTLFAPETATAEATTESELGN